jgi:hypothetical protein
MPIISSKLGNGFVFHDADSTKDQEHYFYGAKKHLEMSCLATLTSSFDTLFMTGSTVIEHSASKWIIHDVKVHPLSSSVIYATGQFLSSSATFLGSKWVTVVSKDRGSTWTLVEATGAVNLNNAGDSIGFANNGDVIVAGIRADAFGSGSGTRVFRSSSDGGVTWENVSGFAQSLAASTNDQAWSRHLNGPRCKILQTPNLPNSLFLIYADNQTSGFRIFSSSDRGPWTSIATLASATLTASGVPAIMSVRDACFSGTTLFIVGGGIPNSNVGQDSYHAFILSASGYGTGSIASVWKKTYNSSFTTNIDIRSIAVDDTTGQLIAVGNDSELNGLVLTSSFGHQNTWFSSSARSLLDSSTTAAQSVFCDKFGNMWIAAHGKKSPGNFSKGMYPNSSILMYRLSGSGDSWKVVYKRPYTSLSSILKIAGEDKYNNLLLVVESGSSIQIQEGFPLSMINLDSSSFTAARPVELRFGLKMRDSSNKVVFDENIKSLFNLDNREAYTIVPPKFNFVFSGNLLNNADSISIRALSGSRVSGSFVEIKHLGINTSMSNGSSSFETGVVPVTNIGLLRVQLSGNQIAATISDFNFNYFQGLTDQGVRYFKDIENQQIEFTYFNQSVMKKVE